MNFVQILEKLYLEKDYTKLFQELQNCNDEQSLYLIGKAYFEQMDFDNAIKVFDSIDVFFEEYSNNAK